MRREEGGGFRMGNTGIPVADSFQYLAKLIQYCKVSRFNARYWMLGASAGTTLRDGMGREEGGGFRMGNTCIPVVDSF